MLHTNSRDGSFGRIPLTRAEAKMSPSLFMAEKIPYNTRSVNTRKRFL